MTETSNPPPAGRAGHGVRDMVLSMAVLLLVIGAVLFVTKGCTLSPGGPSVDQGSMPTADASAELRSAATTVRFPVHDVRLPAGWRVNAATTAPVGKGAAGTVAIRVGTITTAGHYLRVSQSDGRIQDLVISEPGLRTDVPPQPSGAVSAAGVSWTVYPAQPGESTWVATQDRAVVVITGSGTPAEFQELAAATVGSPPLPRG